MMMTVTIPFELSRNSILSKKLSTKCFSRFDLDAMVREYVVQFEGYLSKQVGFDVNMEFAGRERSDILVRVSEADYLKCCEKLNVSQMTNILFTFGRDGYEDSPPVDPDAPDFNDMNYLVAMRVLIVLCGGNRAKIVGDMAQLMDKFINGLEDKA